MKRANRDHSAKFVSILTGSHLPRRSYSPFGGGDYRHDTTYTLVFDPDPEGTRTHCVARRRAVLRQPCTSFSSYAGRDFIEVLTKCRVQYFSRSDARFVDAQRS
jgi:hypothetical protein